MSATTELYQVANAHQFPANVIARASGAPAIPEVDERIPDLENIAPMIMTTSATAMANQGKGVSEEQFEAHEQRVVRKLECAPLVFIALTCGGFCLGHAIVTASSESTGAAFASAAGYLAGLALVAMIAVASIYATAMLFSADMGTIGTIALRCVAIKAVLDIAVLAVGTALGIVAAAICAILLAAMLLHWLFRLDPLQLIVVLAINGLAQVVLFGAAMGAAMNSWY